MDDQDTGVEMDNQNNLQARIQDALAAKRNLGEMSDADSVGTAGSADCGDMLRMWLKFREDEQGRRVIDRATFQTFGCETAIAVASVATELLAGKTAQEAMDLSGEDLAAPLGALPPMTNIRIEWRFLGPLLTFMQRREAPGGKEITSSGFRSTCSSRPFSFCQLARQVPVMAMKVSLVSWLCSIGPLPGRARQ